MVGRTGRHAGQDRQECRAVQPNISELSGRKAGSVLQAGKQV
jgi:hypothetical protein